MKAKDVKEGMRVKVKSGEFAGYEGTVYMVWQKGITYNVDVKLDSWIDIIGITVHRASELKEVKESYSGKNSVPTKPATRAGIKGRR